MGHWRFQPRVLRQPVLRPPLSGLYHFGLSGPTIESWGRRGSCHASNSSSPLPRHYGHFACGVFGRMSMPHWIRAGCHQSRQVPACSPCVRIRPAWRRCAYLEGETCLTPCALTVPTEPQSVTFAKAGFVPQTIQVNTGDPPDHSFWESALRARWLPTRCKWLIFGSTASSRRPSKARTRSVSGPGRRPMTPPPRHRHYATGAQPASARSTAFATACFIALPAAADRLDGLTVTGAAGPNAQSPARARPFGGGPLTSRLRRCPGRSGLHPAQ